MELELHQLDLRYEQLRTRDAATRAAAAGLAGRGGAAGADRGRARRRATGATSLVDGYKRVRALRRLRAGHGARDVLGARARPRRCCSSG